jgi:hypothetical protein
MAQSSQIMGEHLRKISEKFFADKKSYGISSLKKYFLLFALAVFLSVIVASPVSATPIDLLPYVHGWWHMNEGNGTSVMDSSGYGNNGTLVGNVLPTWDIGKLGECLDFDTQGYVDIPDSLSLNLTNSISIEMWVNTTGQTDYNIAVGRGYLTSYLLGTGSGGDASISFYYGGANFLTYNVIVYNTWQHIVVTYDRSTTTAVLYVDGQAVNTNTNIDPAVSGGSVDLGIGTSPDKFDNGNSFIGQIDEVVIYDKALTADEVAFRYNNGSGTELMNDSFPIPSGSLVGYWNFDEGNGTVAYDSSVYGNNGTLVNSPVWVTGRFGNALRFDGSSAYIAVPDSPSLSLTNISFFSWIRLDGSSLGYDYGIIAKNGLWGATFDNYQFDVRLGGKLEFAFRGFDGSGNEYLTDDVVVNDTAWHFVGFTYDSTSNPIIYVDGVAVNGTFVSGGIVALGVNSLPLYIGVFQDFSSSFFNGTMDELRLYNFSLSPTQVGNLYNYNSLTSPPQATETHLFFDGVEENKTVHSDESVNITSAVNVSGEYLRVLVNGTSLNYSETPLRVNASLYGFFGDTSSCLERFNVTAYYAGDSMYNSSSKTLWLDVVKNSSLCLGLSSVSIRFWTDLNATVPYYNEFLWVYAVPNCTWWQFFWNGQLCDNTTYYHAKYTGGDAFLNTPSGATYDLYAVDGAVYWACDRCAPNVTSYDDWFMFDRITPTDNATYNYFWNTTTEGRYPLFSNADWNFWLSIGGIVILIAVAGICAYVTENAVATAFIIILVYILLQIFGILGHIFWGII